MDCATARPSVSLAFGRVDAPIVQLVLDARSPEPRAGVRRGGCRTGRRSQSGSRTSQFSQPALEQPATAFQDRRRRPGQPRPCRAAAAINMDGGLRQS